MHLRMKETRAGSPNGRDVFSYAAGETYSDSSTPRLSADLAAVFLAEGWAEEVQEAPFRDLDAAPAVARPDAAAAPVASEPAPPAEGPAVAEAATPEAGSDAPAAPSEPAATPEPAPAEAAPEPVKPAKKSAGPVPTDPAPGSSEPS